MEWRRGRLEFGGDRTGRRTRPPAPVESAVWLDEGAVATDWAVADRRALTRRRSYRAGWSGPAGWSGAGVGRHGRLGTRRLRASGPTCCDRRRARHARSAAARTSSPSPRPRLRPDSTPGRHQGVGDHVDRSRPAPPGTRRSVRPRAATTACSRRRIRPAARCRAGPTRTSAPDAGSDNDRLHPGPAAGRGTRVRLRVRRQPTSRSRPCSSWSPSWSTAPATSPATRRPGTTEPIRLPVRPAGAGAAAGEVLSRSGRRPQHRAYASGGRGSTRATPSELVRVRSRAPGTSPRTGAAAPRRACRRRCNPARHASTLETGGFPDAAVAAPAARRCSRTPSHRRLAAPRAPRPPRPHRAASVVSGGRRSSAQPVGGRSCTAAGLWCPSTSCRGARRQLGRSAARRWVRGVGSTSDQIEQRPGSNAQATNSSGAAGSAAGRRRCVSITAAPAVLLRGLDAWSCAPAARHWSAFSGGDPEVDPDPLAVRRTASFDGVRAPRIMSASSAGSTSKIRSSVAVEPRLGTSGPPPSRVR